jgi:GT2 family glycosyltransferase
MPDLVLDGELYTSNKDVDFNTIISCVRKTKPTPADLELSKHIGEIILIDNANEYDKHITKKYDKIKVLAQETNIFVNPAWNQIMEKFLTSAHDYLIILNSDLVLKPGILNKIRETDIDYEKTIMLPNPVNEFSVNPPNTVDEIPGGFPGNPFYGV